MATTWRPKFNHRGQPVDPTPPERPLPWEDRPGEKSLARWTIRLGIYGGMFLIGLTLGMECPEHRVLAPDSNHPATQPRPADPNVAAELEGTAGPVGLVGRVDAASRRVRTDDRRLLAAIALIESGNCDSLVGDRGRSRGRYQIQRPYWSEACRFGGVAWSYDRYVTDPRRCEQVIRWYWQLHGARTPQAKARIHNGGPSGMHVAATKAYWTKVDAASRRVRKG